MTDVERCEICGERFAPNDERAEMYQPFNAFARVTIDGTTILTWADDAFLSIGHVDIATVSADVFTSTGPVYVCVTCGNTDGGSCGCASLSFLCHAQCGLSRGYEIA